MKKNLKPTSVRTHLFHALHLNNVRLHRPEPVASSNLERNTQHPQLKTTLRYHTAVRRLHIHHKNTEVTMTPPNTNSLSTASRRSATLKIELLSPKMLAMSSTFRCAFCGGKRVEVECRMDGEGGGRCTTSASSVAVVVYRARASA